MQKNACDMGNMFSDLEALKLAIDMEARGRDFYKKAYDKADNKDHKDLFMLLMNEEIQHHQQFTELYNKISENKDAGSDDYLFDQDTSRYLTVLAEPFVFPQDKEDVSKLNNLGDILRASIQDEKDSILFYDALAKCAKFEAARNVFNQLKAEEQTHVVKLREMLKGWA